MGKNKLKKYFKKKLENKNNFYIIFIWFIVFLFGLFFLLIITILYLKLFTNLPDITQLKNLKVPEASIIYDRKGGELYKIYSENRIYVNYDYINKNMINAIVAGEDKRFWTNPGFDFLGIIRAIIEGIKHNNHFEGTSGITQQLAKITYLSSERSIERKIKELYLAIELNNHFSKKDILEIYLNKVFFGGNSYGVEQASKTFFGINASELNILQSSILASLPKAPTGLSPYIHKDRLLGYPLVSKKIGEEIKIKILDKKSLKANEIAVNNLKSFINGLKIFHIGNKLKICNLNQNRIKNNYFIVGKDKCFNLDFSDFLKFLNSIYIDKDGYIVEYKTGRKDYILYRMYEDNYITSSQLKKAIIDSFGFEFNKYIDKIRYPYFVMYVKDYLVKKYGEDLLMKGGLRIYTSIDPDLQDKAQHYIENQVGYNEKNFGAKNAAMMAVDNKTGEILVFIGGVDYFDKEILGNNNMIFARLQPGSIFKPFVYILAMMKKKYYPWTYITDNKMTFPGGYRPNNSDGGFMGKMTFSQALNSSRNIPAIKLYFPAGKEEGIIKFLEKFGVKSLREFKREYKKKYGIDYRYGPPMAIGTANMSMFELIKVYSTFANGGVQNKIKPVLRIYNSRGKMIKDFTKQKNQKQIIPRFWAYTINKMLSTEYDRPKEWNRFLTIPGRKLAAKTGTSTKEYYSKKWTKDSKGRWYHRKIIVSKNLWTVGYTPQITTIVWAGNTSGKGLYGEAYGLTGAAPVMRAFMKYAHHNLPVEEWKKN